MKSNIYLCPKCSEELADNGKSMACGNGHSYDIAASGYVNLLLSGQKNAKLPGDNALMVNARKNFLDRGYYADLRERLAETVCRYFSGGALFDAGCGEGYYTIYAAEKLKSGGEDFCICGADISKTAVNCAAKRFKGFGDNVRLSVASVFHLPVKSSSCAMLTTLFAPYCAEEYSRVLEKNGIMIVVIPSERHLFGLKKAVYDKPYLNEVKPFELDYFELAEHIHLDNEITLSCGEDIKNLFTMTPYYYKTGVKEQERLSILETLTTETAFDILVYRKKEV